ncbi:MAG: hypothetical protein HZA22_12785 [Nitrospirae bacterium]|nr:hypothetical protein [Nitrospirota bacterium]MBI5694435.1 hypothetical protein [Nitrospirota bacterium]
MHKTVTWLFIFTLALFLVAAPLPCQETPPALAQQDEDVPYAEKVGVEGWMTLADVSNTFSIPLEKLTGRFNVSEEDAATKRIGELGLTIPEVQLAVDRYWDPEAIVEAQKEGYENIRDENGQPMPEFVPQEEADEDSGEAGGEAAEQQAEPEVPQSTLYVVAVNLGMAAAALLFGYYFFRMRKRG